MNRYRSFSSCKQYTRDIKLKFLFKMLKILFLSAEPTNASRLRVGEEIRSIQEQLQASKQKREILLEQKHALRWKDFSRAMVDVQPHVVHFSGHGAVSGQLCFETETGTMQEIDPYLLAELFEIVADQIKCVVLNACYTRLQAETISQHISCVIGMKNSILDSAAIEFSTGFYKALSAGFSIEKSFKFGCVEMKLVHSLEAETPVLLKKESEQTQHPPEIEWMLELSGRLTDESMSEVLELSTLLSKLLNDDSIKIQKVKKGSIKIFFTGSEDSFDILKRLFEEGKLTSLMGYPVRTIQYAAQDRDHLEEVLERPELKELLSTDQLPEVDVQSSSVTIVCPPGILNAEKVSIFESQVQAVLSRNSIRELIVDMSAVESLDNAGLVSFMTVLNTARPRAKIISIVSAPPSVRIVFELTQLDRVFKVRDSSYRPSVNSLQQAS